jgi:hypothetical protein
MIDRAVCEGNIANGNGGCVIAFDLAEVIASNGARFFGNQAINGGAFALETGAIVILSKLDRPRRLEDGLTCCAAQRSSHCVSQQWIGTTISESIKSFD